MRAIEVFASAEGGNLVRWLIPLGRVIWVRWAEGRTSIRTMDGMTLDCDDGDAMYYADIHRAFSQDTGVYRVGGEWRFWHEEVE